MAESVAAEKTPIEKVNHYFTLILTLNITSMLSAMLLFGERFDFWNHAASDLGLTVTDNGSANYKSLFLFSAGMIASGYLCLQIHKILKAYSFKHKEMKLLLLKTCSLGYFGIVTPYNISHTLHVLGATSLFGSLYFLTVVLLFELKEQGKRFEFYVFQLLLQGTILPYALLYFLDSPVRNVAQKFAVAGLMLSLRACMRKEKFSWLFGDVSAQSS